MARVGNRTHVSQSSMTAETAKSSFENLHLDQQPNEGEVSGLYSPVFTSMLT